MTAGDDRVWDRGLQPERTSLAWQRTALAMLALGLAIPRLTWAMAQWSIGVSAVIVTAALAVFALAQRRYRHTHRTLTEAVGRLHDGRLPLVVSALAAILGMVALVGLVIL